MKNLWPVALLSSSLVVCLSAQDQPSKPTESPQDSGNAFVRLCSVVDDTKHLSGEEFGNLAGCIGYIDGFTEGVGMEGLYASAKDKNIASVPFCIPEGAEAGQLIRVVLKYIRNNPELAHEHTAVIIVKSLGKAYPCTNK
jgi:hypothetical protein